MVYYFFDGVYELIVFFVEFDWGLDVSIYLLLEVIEVGFCLEGGFEVMLVVEKVIMFDFEIFKDW